MIPESVLRQALEDTLPVEAWKVGVTEGYAPKLLAACHRLMNKELQPEAVKLVAAISVLEDFLRKDLSNQVHLRSYFAFAVSPTEMHPFKGTSTRNHHRLADALILLATEIVKGQ